MDAGPIIMQASVPVLSDDTVESLSERIWLKNISYLKTIQSVLNQDLT